MNRRPSAPESPASAAARPWIAAPSAGLAAARWLAPTAVLRHIRLGGLHQVGDQVVAALQLHVDLRKCVLEAVSERNQAVVDRDRPEEGRSEYHQKNDQSGPVHAFLL